MSQLDAAFNGVAAGTSIPCGAAGANAISLTSGAGFPAPTSNGQLSSYRFIAAATSSGAVTAQANGLGFLPVYHGDGVTQANVGDIVANQQYIITFNQALNGGLGGWFLEAPSVPNAPATWFTPGGRLTVNSGVPINFTTNGNAQTIFYAPYVHQFVPVYNGSLVQMVDFCSSLSDQVGLSLVMAGSGNWPSGFGFDVFVTLVAGVPTLATVQWTSLVTRATGLSIFAGFLTNGGAVNMRTSAGVIGPVPVNQATFLGSFATNAGIAGALAWGFGSAASGGGSANFGLCNYYNKALFNTIVTDNGTGYTYSSATTRQARASAGNQILIMQSDSERSVVCSYQAMETIGGGTSNGVVATGMGIDTLSAFATFNQANSSATFAELFGTPTSLSFSATGFHNLSANEKGDGTNANTFDTSGANQLMAAIWL
jgi:hypothetical protein